MSDCRHDTIVTWGTPDNRLWACAPCSRRFYPACETCVDVGHRNMSHPEPATPDAPIHRHAPDALCVPSWCPVGAAEAARKQERERLAAAVEVIPEATYEQTVDEGCVSRAAVLSIIRETDPKEADRG